MSFHVTVTAVKQTTIAKARTNKISGPTRGSDYKSLPQDFVYHKRSLIVNVLMSAS